jgi:hypothetical protein
MTVGSVGMLLDRGLTLPQLECAFDIAVADPDPKTNRRRLTIALRDLVSDQEAEGKTKKCLTRVWLNPPEAASEMIDWARRAPCPPESRALLHFGALLATFPFVGAVARVIGQHLALDGRVDAPTVRIAVRRQFGDRSSVDVAARKAYTTLCNIGMLTKEGQSLRPVATPWVSPSMLAPWIAHALLLTRQAESLPATSIRSAPELLGVEMPGAMDRTYPFLEIFTDGDGPVVALSA